MKKLLTILLSLAMILSMGTVTFAEEEETIESVDDSSNSVDIDVMADLVDGTIGDTIGAPTYNVVVTWTYDGNISGIKNESTVYLWNSETFSYDIVDEEHSFSGLAYKDGDDTRENYSYSKVKIDVDNKSDAMVKVAITYVPVENSASKPCSMITEDFTDNSTQSFNIANDSTLDSMFGEGLAGKSLDEFDKYVFNLYTEEGYGIACDAFGAEEFEENDINGLITWLKADSTASGAVCPAYEKFGELAPEDASDLLRIYAENYDTDLNLGYSLHDLINSSHLTKRTTGDTYVKLTEYGEEYLMSKDASNDIKVGHFNVKVSVPNIG